MQLAVPAHCALLPNVTKCWDMSKIQAIFSVRPK